MASVLTQISSWVLVTIAAVLVALVIVKTVELWRASAMNRRFAAAFRSAPGLDSVASISARGSSLAQIADVGLGFLRHARAGDRGDLLRLNLERQARREQRRLESGLGFLSAAGNLALLAGLLCSLWGSAPPQAGLGVALLIPAWLAGRLLQHRVKSIGNDLDDFVIDFLNLAERGAPAHRAATRNTSRPQLVFTSARTR